jgi:hypothetical protein
MNSAGHLHRVIGVRELMRQRRSPTIFPTAPSGPGDTPRCGDLQQGEPAARHDFQRHLRSRQPVDLLERSGRVARQQLKPDLRRARSPTRTTPATSSPWSKQGNRSRASTCTTGWDVGSPARSETPRPSPAYEGWNLLQERANNNSVSANHLTGLGLDQPFLRTAGSSTSYYLSDALESIVGSPPRPGPCRPHDRPCDRLTDRPADRPAKRWLHVGVGDVDSLCSLILEGLKETKAVHHIVQPGPPSESFCEPIRLGEEVHLEPELVCVRFATGLRHALVPHPGVP